MSGAMSPSAQWWLLTRGRGGGGAPAFSPASLFAAGEQGAWYDPSDLTTLWQDTAGTVPVTAPGDTVALIRDKSGRGNDATQSITTARPTYRVDAGGRGYLEFDGTDDCLSTSSINFTATNKMTVFAGLRKINDAVTGVVCELSVNSATNSGAFNILAPNLTFSYSALTRGTSTAQVTTTGFAAPITNVVASLSDIAAPNVLLRVDGAQRAQSTNTQGTGNYGNYPLFIGRRNGVSLSFSGWLYGLIVRGAATDAATIGQTETWLAARTGVTL
jgi:hypothetical protein